MDSGVIGSAEVRSADGTTVGFEVTGSGPGLVIVHGTLRAGRHYRNLAAAIASDFTVYTVDRRGRGATGPQGDGYGIDRECEDLAAVIRHTDASFVFGHSYGGLVALELALRRPTPPIQRLAVYEPAISVNGGISPAWLPELADAVAEGRTSDGVASVISGLQLAGPLGHVPLRLQKVLVRVIMRGDFADDMRLLLPTVHAEVLTATGLDSSGGRYSDVTKDILLLAGERGPNYLREVVETLSAFVPRSESRVLPKLGHNAPDLDAPDAIAAELRQYFTEARTR
jgi:pimeloyl-ACP methyl ester carboxylesterase